MNEEQKSRVQKQFGKTAGDYACSDVHARGESLAYLVDLARPLPTWHVLDVATGAGHTAVAFAPHVAAVTATDITPAMLTETLRLAERQGISNLVAVYADAESLPFENGRFDLVTCRLAMHHFADPNRFLKEAWRVLRDDGLFGLTDNFAVDEPSAADYYNRFEKIRDPSHERVCPLDQLKQMIGNAGFELQQTVTMSKEFEFQQWANRQRVSDSDKQVLIGMLRELPPKLEPFLKPRWADDTLYFHLWETVLLARKRTA